LNNVFRAQYRSPVIFWKWVTRDYLSPNFDGGTRIKYEIGSTVEEPTAIVSDQRCGVVLHVLRPPYRPEWLGLCKAEHDLICLAVEVQPEDILFAGIPTMDAKIRVRKLRVIGEEVEPDTGVRQRA